MIIVGLMAFSAGGILSIIFPDLAPQIRLENSSIPPLGAVPGFLIGLVGKSLTEGQRGSCSRPRPHRLFEMINGLTHRLDDLGMVIRDIV